MTKPAADAFAPRQSLAYVQDLEDTLNQIADVLGVLRGNPEALIERVKKAVVEAEAATLLVTQDKRPAFEVWARNQWGDRQWPDNAWLGFQAGYDAGFRASAARAPSLGIPAPLPDGYTLPAECVVALVEQAQKARQDRVTFGVMIPTPGEPLPARYAGVVSESVENLQAAIGARASSEKSCG